MYASIEILSAILGSIFATMIYLSGVGGYTLIFSIVIAVIATVVIASYTLYDLLYLEIPDEVLIPGTIFVFAGLLISSYLPGLDWIYHIPMSFPYDIPLTNGVLGALAIYSFFMIQIVLSGGKWM